MKNQKTLCFAGGVTNAKVIILNIANARTKMFDKIYKQFKSAESFYYMEMILSSLVKLESSINHSKSKMISGDDSEKAIWEGIIEIIRERQKI